MSTVIDPSAFSKDCFTVPGYRENAELFFRGIRSNGLLIVDSAGQLKDSLVTTISSLPTQYGQQLTVWLEELLKNKRKRIIQCHPDACNLASRCDLLELACQIKTVCKVDMLIASNQSINQLRSKGALDSNVISLAEYINSEFERQRRRFSEELPPIDQLSNPELDDLITRIIKFAKWIRFYDKQIGTGNNTSHFRKGIQYILKLWQENGHFASRRIEFVEIITCRKEIIKNDDFHHVKENKRRDNEKSFQKVTRELIEPLKKEFSWPIELKVNGNFGF